MPGWANKGDERSHEDSREISDGHWALGGVAVCPGRGRADGSRGGTGTDLAGRLSVGGHQTAADPRLLRLRLLLLQLHGAGAQSVIAVSTIPRNKAPKFRQAHCGCRPSPATSPAAPPSASPQTPLARQSLRQAHIPRPSLPLPPRPSPSHHVHRSAAWPPPQSSAAPSQPPEQPLTSAYDTRLWPGSSR